MRFQRQRNLAGGLLNLSSSASKIGVAVGAIAVIGVCGFLIWRGLIRQQPPPPPPTMVTVMECEKCHNKKEFSQAELTEMGKEKVMAMVINGLDCPKCSGDKTMKLTIECPIPTCHFHYLQVASGENICPKCGANYTKARIANP
jgi:hypothetical protein